MKSVRVQDFFEALDAMAPFSTALPYDNAGLLVGDETAQVQGVALGLDLTAELVEWAHEQGCNLIISHHPVIFKPVSRVLSNDPVYRMARYGMSAICVHTNLDCAVGGVNDVLAKTLGLSEVEPLADPEFPNLPPLARMGCLLKEMSAAELAEHVRECLGVAAVGYADGGNKINRVAVCGGAGADLLSAAKQAGAHALVTADVRHHELLDAIDAGITVVDGGHFATEVGVMKPLAETLSKQFPGVKICLLGQKNPLEYAVK